jgi:hypothetical protein
MITGWEIYWITRLDAILVVFGTLAALFLIALLCFALIAGAEGCRGETYKRWIFRLALPAIVFVIITALIPSTKTAVAIYVIPKIANNEQVQKLPDNAVKFLNTKLEAWINETLKEKEKK